MILRSSNVRRGLTLLEVIIALLIFLPSVVAILVLVQIGTDRATEVRMQTRTSMRCQAKLAEWMIGSPEVPINGAPTFQNFTDNEQDSDLQWRMEAEPRDEQQMLWTVKVWVQGKLSGGRVVESYLCQLALNPKNRGTTFDPPVLSAASAAPAGSSSTDPATPATPAATTPAAPAATIPAAPAKTVTPAVPMPVVPAAPAKKGG
ncbi:MAG: prepilin-type N-terminal cleavage/methylation domain-containing protein [Planctomycetes bacterium]|nr:prepilin-type N-terminal cleavage/methylation domain-containing protein [Planctomycetota bacterium]